MAVLRQDEGVAARLAAARRPASFVLLTLFLLSIVLVPTRSLMAQTTTFTYTGAMQAFIVPAGVTSVNFTVLGGGGGGGGLDSTGFGGAGGKGGVVSGTYPVVPGSTLQIYVGGGGGAGGSGVTCTGGGAGGALGYAGGAGGAAGCSGSSGAGGGGGASSSVATSGGAILIVAGGGGGGQGGALTSNPGLAGGNSSSTGTLPGGAGTAGVGYSGDGGGGGGGGGGCAPGGAGTGHADKTNAGAAAGGGGSCANTSLVTNFQVLGATGGVGGTGATSSAASTAGGGGSVTVSYGGAATYVYTGAMQTYTVPIGISWITITASGAGGGGAGADASGNGGNGGNGASVAASYPVSPGSVLDIYVGGGGGGGSTSTSAYTCTTAFGAGGWSDYAGGAGGEPGCSGYSGGAGGGGGASAVTTSSGILLIIAGAGGGGQGGSLNQGGLTGGNSLASGSLPGGAGATGVSLTGDGGGGGGGGGGCAGGAAGIGHADNTSGGTVAGAGGSCANTAKVSNFQLLGVGGAGGLGATSTSTLGAFGGNGVVVLSYSSGPDHYAVTHAASGVNCQPEPITIVGHTSSHTVATTTTTITVTTSTGHGDWTLTSGSGTFLPGPSNSGSAVYTYVTNDNGSVVLSLRDTYSETVTVNVTDGMATQTTGSALPSENTTLTFAPSGFRFTNGANTAALIGTQVAGMTSTQALALQAIRTDTVTGACTGVFASGQTANVSLGFQCNNPTACVAGQRFTLTNGGVSTTLASNSAAAVANYTTVPLTFGTANAEAPFTISYSDVGQVTLAAKYSIPLGNGAASGTAMTGSGQFVVQPYTLVLSNINAASTGTPNPAAVSATGPMFIGAGQSFTSSVTANNYQGNATPNFGSEIAPTTVSLTSTLVLPSSGHNPAVTGSFGAFSGGVAAGSGFSWPEVGILTLTPAVTNYLGSGPLTGTVSANIGRFVPNSFIVSINTPVIGTGCAAGSFSYLGQPLTYTVPPVITATALALGGATTQNYTGPLLRVSNTSLTGRSYTSAASAPALVLTGLPATSVDPTIADLGNGQFTLTFSAGSGLSFARAGVIAPFGANISLAENVIDLDGITGPNPVTFGGGSGIVFSTSNAQYYGRLNIKSTLGSELLDLPMPLVSEYYSSATQGFVTNTADACSTAPTLGFGSYQQNLAGGSVCVRDTGNPGASGQGCATVASNHYLSPVAAGNFNLILAAPGSGKNGAMTVTANAPTWLQYLWNATSAVNTSPAAMATFGVFPGSASRVYQREVY